VVVGSGLQVAVEDADEPVAELPEGGVVRDSTGADDEVQEDGSATSRRMRVAAGVGDEGGASGEEAAASRRGRPWRRNLRRRTGLGEGRGDDR
jgi:hypothetical protein